jgi:hypothetical protein
MKKRFAIAGVRDGGVLPERSTVISYVMNPFFGNRFGEENME